MPPKTKPGKKSKKDKEKKSKKGKEKPLVKRESDKKPKKKDFVKWKRDGYYEPWTIPLPWPEYQRRFDHIERSYIRGPMETRKCSRGLCYYARFREEKRAQVAAALQKKKKGKK